MKKNHLRQVGALLSAISSQEAWEIFENGETTIASEPKQTWSTWRCRVHLSSVLILARFIWNGSQKNKERLRHQRDVDNMYLVQALVGMRQKTRQILARNLSSRLRAMIIEDCYQCADIDDSAIAEGAVYITEKLKVLQACGEIMDAESRILI